MQLKKVTTQKGRDFNVQSIIHVITENKKNKTRLYHKRDALHFSLVGMPHLGINIPPNI